MKKIMMIALMTAMTLAASAQEKKTIELPAWLNNVKLSGYGMVQYQASDKEGDEQNSFQLRLLRLSLEGRIQQDWYWKMQLQMNGNVSSLNSSPRIVDAFAEWQKYEFFKVKAGQFKRPFTFENPMHPITQGFMSYSQPVSKLSGFSDRTGEHSCNGRDIGLQFQGDFLKNSSGRNLIHYQVGVFNGQGINVKDVDERKDIIGGAWVMPISGMRIGAFGWEGSYARKAGGQTVSLRQHRYAFSAEYKKGDLQLRTEYIHSTGRGFASTYQNPSNASDLTIKTYTDKNGNEVANDKSDGIYALAIVPVVKDKLMAKARYDLYRPTASNVAAKTNYEVGLNYRFCKYLEAQTEYCFTHDRALAKPDYSTVFVQLSIRY